MTIIFTLSLLMRNSLMPCGVFQSHSVRPLVSPVNMPKYTLFVLQVRMLCTACTAPIQSQSFSGFSRSVHLWHRNPVHGHKDGVAQCSNVQLSQMQVVTPFAAVVRHLLAV